MSLAHKFPDGPAIIDRLTTVAEYLLLPGERNELVDGAVTSMAPCTPVHGRLQARLAMLIGQHLEKNGGPCWVATEPGVQPRVQANVNVRIPNLGVSCTPETSEDRFLRDPVLLVEILSPSNGKDTSNNMLAYATIPSVVEVLVVDSTQRAVQHLYRDADGNWPYAATSVGEAETITLSSIGLSLTMAEIYAGTSLAASAA